MVASTVPISLEVAKNPDFWMAPFVKSAQRVIPTMLASGCEAGPADCVSSGHAMYDLTSVIGMTGIVSGALAFSLSREAAIDVLRRMTGVETTEVDELVRDCVGEMANMIAGGGKLDLQPFPLKLGLPQVIQGHDYAVYAPRWSIHEWVPLETDFGPCSLTLGFDLAGLQSHLMGRSQ